MKTFVFFLFVSANLLFAADPALRTKTDVQDDYNRSYLTSSVSTTELGWTGTLSPCNPGTIAALVHPRVLRRINYFRRFCGLQDSVVLDTVYNRKCQDMALMIDVKDSLSHFPPTNWPCYTAAGAEAASKSNIYWNRHSASAITGFIQDDGTGNTAVGHRRWILYSRGRTFGHGSTPGASCLWVLGNSANPIPSTQPAFTAYPPAGFVPAPLVFARWSFGIPAADFRSATVAMKNGSGAPIPVTRETVSHNSYGDNTVVWKPTGISLSGPADVVCTVTVSGVLSAPQASYTYAVRIFQPSTSADEAGSGLRSDGRTLRCSPNPFRTAARFSFSIAGATGVSLAIYDPAGRLIRRFDLSSFAPGTGEVEFEPAPSLPPGPYVAILARSGHRVSRVFTLLR